MTDDIASGAIQYLLALADVTALVGAVPVTAGDPNSAVPLIWKDSQLYVLEGTSMAQLVVSDYGGTGPGQPLITPRFKRLSIEFYVDPQRDPNKNITESPGLTRQRLMAIFNQVNLHLHRTNPDSVMWGDLRTITSELLTEPHPQDSPDGDGMQYGQAFWGVTVLGTSDSHAF